MTAKQHIMLTNINERHVTKTELLKIMKILNIINNHPESVSVTHTSDELMAASNAYKAMNYVGKIVKHIK